VEKLLTEALRRTGEKAGHFSQEWIGQTADQIAAGIILRDPAQIGRFLGSHGRELSGESARFLRQLMDRPAFFSAFSAKTLEEDFFEILDYSSRTREVLCSSALGELYRQRAESYITLLFSNGVCLQALGPMHYYRGFENIDFHYCAKMLRPYSYAAGGLSALITTMPEWFVILDSYTEIPPIGHEGDRVYSCSSLVSTPAFEPSLLAANFEIAEAKGMVRCRLKGSSPPLRAADIYWEPKKKRLFLHAKRMAEYNVLAKAAANQIEIPPAPQWYATQNMEIAAISLLHRDPHVIAYERAFAEPEPTPEKKAEMAKLNALLREITNATNHGLPYSLEEASARHGVAMETALQIRAMLERQARDFAIDVEGGLPDVPVLPPSERMKLRAELDRSELFRYSTDDQAQRLFREVAPGLESLRGKTRVSRDIRMLTLAALPAYLDELDDPTWKDPSHMVLKHTLYLLCIKGSEFESTMDYASEVLKLFWRVLLPSQDQADIKRFTRQYTIWCREVIVRGGLAEADSSSSGARDSSDAPFRIKATPFFKAWAGLRVKGRTPRSTP
jgi:hypothetical protein